MPMLYAMNMISIISCMETEAEYRNEEDPITDMDVGNFMDFLSVMGSDELVTLDRSLSDQVAEINKTREIIATILKYREQNDL